MANELIFAAGSRNLEKVKYLLSEGGAHIKIITSALLHAVANGKISMATWLLEHGGATITTTRLLEHAGGTQGRTVWDLLIGYTLWRDHDAAALNALLRAMIVRGAPPVHFLLRPSLSMKQKQIVREGMRLKTRLPAYLSQRRALLDTHCPLIPPLQALVRGYEEPTTTDELWATGLGAEA